MWYRDSLNTLPYGTGMCSRSQVHWRSIQRAWCRVPSCLSASHSAISWGWKVGNYLPWRSDKGNICDLEKEALGVELRAAFDEWQVRNVLRVVIALPTAHRKCSVPSMMVASPRKSDANQWVDNFGPNCWHKKDGSCLFSTYHLHHVASFCILVLLGTME